MGWFKNVVGSIFGGGGGGGPSVAEQTAGAYEYGESTYSMLSTGRARGETKYERSMATGRARMAASGSELEGATWESFKGEALRVRTESREKYSTGMSDFRGSENYKLFKEDYERMTRLGTGDTKGRSAEVEAAQLTGKGASGESFLTTGQKKTVISEKGGKSDLVSYGKYKKLIYPTLKEWELGRFGTKEQKAEYVTMMDTRISEANEWFKAQGVLRSSNKRNQKSFYVAGRGDR